MRGFSRGGANARAPSLRSFSGALALRLLRRTSPAPRPTSPLRLTTRSETPKHLDPTPRSQVRPARSMPPVAEAVSHPGRLPLQPNRHRACLQFSKELLVATLPRTSDTPGSRRSSRPLKTRASRRGPGETYGVPAPADPVVPTLESLTGRIEAQPSEQNSRLLICPGVRVPNLASRVLVLALQRLPEDWKRRYGYEPGARQGGGGAPA